MTVSSSATNTPVHGVGDEFDLKLAIADNRLTGLWHLMSGYRLRYAAATASLDFAHGEFASRALPRR
jgi:hypothetical protein